MKKKQSIYERPAAIIYPFMFLIILSLSVGFAAKAQSSKFEPPKEANDIRNPLAGNTAVLKDAKLMYTSYCVPCHGEKGKGDGVAASGLATKPADHSGSHVQMQTDGALFWELSEGHNPMPPYKTTLTENQRWSLINYIRTLAKTPKKP